MVEIDRSNPWPDAYKRRDYQLGITKEAFIATPYPDRDKTTNVYVACSDDPAVKADYAHPAKLYSDALEKAGVVSCSLLRPPMSEYSTRPLEAGLDLGDHDLLTSFLFINEDGSDTKRLFSISTDGNEAYYPSLVPAFLTAYGTPAVDRNETWQNRMGATFDNRIMSWSKGSSTITLQQRTSKADVFRAEYKLDPLSDLLDRRLNEQSTAAASKL